MDEPSTKILNTTVNKATVKETDVTALLDADEMIFYHNIRPDLDLLQKKPSPHIIDNILNFSKSLR